jgi:hypothetical protein
VEAAGSVSEYAAGSPRITTLKTNFANAINVPGAYTRPRPCALSVVVAPSRCLLPCGRAYYVAEPQPTDRDSWTQSAKWRARRVRTGGGSLARAV